jgi:hypothetical protein
VRAGPCVIESQFTCAFAPLEKLASNIAVTFAVQRVMPPFMDLPATVSTSIFPKHWALMASWIAMPPRGSADARDHAAASAVKIGDQKKRGGNDERQDKEQRVPFASLAVTDQQIARNRHQRHHGPCAEWPMRRRVSGSSRPSVALRVDDIVHAGQHQRCYRRRLAGCGWQHDGPELALHACRLKNKPGYDHNEIEFAESKLAELYPEHPLR